MLRVFALLVACLSWTPLTARALDCAPAPGAGSAEPALDASAGVLIRALDEGRFDADGPGILRAIERSHPQADPVVVKLVVLRAACAQLEADPGRTEAAKRAQLMALEQRFELPARRSAAASGPLSVARAARGGAFTEVVAFLRSAGTSAGPTPTVRVALLVDGGAVAERSLQPGPEAGDLERVSVALPQPVDLARCGDLALEVSLSGGSDEWAFDLAGAVVRTRAGEALHGLFGSEGPVTLDAGGGSRIFDVRLEGCRQQTR